MSSQNEAHFQGFPELTHDAPPTPDAYVDAPTTTRRDKDTRMVSLYPSYDGSCMPILGSCASEEIDDFAWGNRSCCPFGSTGKKRSLAERDFVEALKTRLTQLRC